MDCFIDSFTFVMVSKQSSHCVVGYGRLRLKNSCDEKREQGFLYTPLHIHTYIYIYLYIFIEHISQTQALGTRRVHVTEILGPRGRCFDIGGLFVDKSVRSSPSCDGPEQAGSNAAIESFWHCIFVKI